MAADHRKLNAGDAQESLLDDPGFLKEIVERVLQELLETQMTEHIGAAPYERSEYRKGQRNGYKPRTLRTRVGTLNLLVPQDREGTFSTRLFARYQRNEKALCLALMEMYVEESPPGRSRTSPRSCVALASPRVRSQVLRRVWTQSLRDGGAGGWKQQLIRTCSWMPAMRRSGWTSGW